MVSLQSPQDSCLGAPAAHHLGAWSPAQISYSEPVALGSRPWLCHSIKRNGVTRGGRQGRPGLGGSQGLSQSLDQLLTQTRPPQESRQAPL